jgi:hypothetical protein
MYIPVIDYDYIKKEFDYEFEDNESGIQVSLPEEYLDYENPGDTKELFFKYMKDLGYEVKFYM